MLEALVACAGVTLNAVATALDIVLRDATLLRLTQCYCVVYQTLAQPPALSLIRKSAVA